MALLLSEQFVVDVDVAGVGVGGGEVEEAGAFVGERCDGLFGGAGVGTDGQRGRVSVVGDGPVTVRHAGWLWQG